MTVIPDMRTRFTRTATELVDSDPSVAVVVADISADQFTEVTDRHPDRVVNVGIREQLMVSVAGGFALAGLHPIAHSYAPFLIERAFEQVKLDLGHQGVNGLLVSVGASYDGSEVGRTHHAPGDVALVDTLPNWDVHVPGHPDEVPHYIRSAVRQGNPAYVRLSTSSNATARPGALDGKLDVVRQSGSGAPHQPLVLAVGPLLDHVLEATDGLDVTVAYATTVRPLDHAGLRELATSGEVILVEPYLAGTSARQVDEALSDRPHRTLALGVGRTDLRKYGSIADHDAAHGLDPAGIRRSITGFLGPN